MRGGGPAQCEPPLEGAEDGGLVGAAVEGGFGEEAGVEGVGVVVLPAGGW